VKNIKEYCIARYEIGEDTPEAYAGKLIKELGVNEAIKQVEKDMKGGIDKFYEDVGMWILAAAVQAD
jgi:hypothetical protein